MKQDSVILAWCDNGMVDGKFTQGIVDVLLKSGIKFKTSLRSQGNQIGRQRETLANHWYNENMSDWLFWVDSDVVVSPETFLKLWNQKDAKERPLMTGVYFTTDNPEEPLMIPKPTLFNFVDNGDGGFGLNRVHPLPKDKLIQVSAAGMGFVLMHRSVITRIREHIPDTPLFTELGVGKKFIGEDIFFFALCDQAGVPLWCDTSATAPHMKRFSLDEHYYNAMTKGR